MGTVVVFGPTSVGGLELCRLLNDGGDHVIAVARPASDLSKLAPIGVEIRTADVMQMDQIATALGDLDPSSTIVSFLGGRRAVDGLGNSNVIGVAEASNLLRFVLVTQIGCGNSKSTKPFLLRLFSGGCARAKTKAEKRLQRSELNWTIIRPGKPKLRKPTHEAILVENPHVKGVINGQDLAQLVLRVLKNRETVGHIYAAVDSKRATTADQSELVEVAV